MDAAPRNNLSVLEYLFVSAAQIVWSDEDDFDLIKGVVAVSLPLMSGATFMVLAAYELLWPTAKAPPLASYVSTLAILFFTYARYASDKKFHSMQFRLFELSKRELIRLRLSAVIIYTLGLAPLIVLIMSIKGHQS